MREENDDAVHVMTAEDMRRIERALECVESFKGDAETLRRMIHVFNAIEGWVKVTRWGGLIVVFVVLTWTNWDRLVDLMRGGK